jgi:hypothetical protein
MVMTALMKSGIDYIHLENFFEAASACQETRNGQCSSVGKGSYGIKNHLFILQCPSLNVNEAANLFKIWAQTSITSLSSSRFDSSNLRRVPERTKMVELKRRILFRFS